MKIDPRREILIAGMGTSSAMLDLLAKMRKCVKMASSNAVALEGT